MSADEEKPSLPVSFEQLAELEDDFEQVDLELTRVQDKLTKDLYVKREKIIADIPHFWNSVFEVAPEEFEHAFKETDGELLLSLKNLFVTRFDLPEGDPRSFSIKWEFEENAFFEDSVLEKKFIYRQSPKGDVSGLVSEPVKIHWKPGKDLTNGLTDLVLKVHAEEKAGKADEETDAKKELKKKIEDTPLGDLSFFTWFAFRGPRITEEEHKESLKKEEEKRQLRKAGKPVEDDEMEEDEEDEDDLFDKAYEYEPYPAADDQALCIAEDIWPDAIKLYLQSQEDDILSEFEDLDDEDEEMEEDDKAEPASKKRKA
ncbi:unnamed protein product [Clonostachys rhizophaga]|uniref:Uncharacterized protein n=1 Tax=Clonostachys rhizophaga TaxID=160324 RepID=A0A9N9YHP6_9HYPO|nr:unnamed protein product [Clonostachys rhizophaga]